jgi:hypothetical protein
MTWLALFALLLPTPTESPAVHADGSITVTLRAPAASTVRVWGDWLHADKEEPMRRLDDGTWTLTTAPLSSGPHLYAFVVDGLRVADPANRRVKNGYPGLSSIVDIPDASLSGLPQGVTHVPGSSPRCGWRAARSSEISSSHAVLPRRLSW